MNTSIFNKLIFVAVLLLLILTPLPYGTVEVWSTTLWELVILALTLLWACDMLQTGRLTIAPNPLALPLFGLLILALAQITVSGGAARPALTYDRYATFQAAVKIFAALLFFLLCATFVNTDERRRTAAKVIIAVCTVIALLAIGQSYLGKLIWQRGSFGPFVNRNHFAGFLEMGIGLAGGLLIGRGTRREWLAVYASGLLVMCAGLALSASRGGALALGAELVFLIAIAAPGWSSAGEKEKARAGILLRTVGALVLGAATVISAVLLVGSEGLVANFAQIENETQATAANYDRFSRRDIWQTSWQIIKDHPLTGVGLGAFQFAYTRYDSSSGAQRVEQSHNDYLQVLTDGGVIGGALALSFMALLFWRGFAAANTRDQRRRSLVLGALTGCFAIAVHSFVDFNLQVTANAQLFLALCAFATTSNERSNQRRG